MTFSLSFTVEGPSISLRRPVISKEDLLTFVPYNNGRLERSLISITINIMINVGVIDRNIPLQHLLNGNNSIYKLNGK